MKRWAWMLSSLATLSCNQALDNPESGSTGWENIPIDGKPGTAFISVAASDSPQTGVAYFLQWDGDGVIPSGYWSVNEPTCRRKQAAGCSLINCTYDLAKPIKSKTPVYRSSGTLSARCGAATAVDFAWNGQDYALAGFQCAAGETATISATGDDVPAFTAELPIAAALNLTQPDPKLGPPTVSRSKGLGLKWAPGPGTLMVFLSAGDFASEYFQIECSFDGGAGSAAIASSLVREIPAGSDVTLDLASAARSLLTPSADWEIAVLTGRTNVANWQTTVVD